MAQQKRDLYVCVEGVALLIYNEIKKKKITRRNFG